MSDIFVFRKFLPGEQTDKARLYLDAAVEKLQTMHPGCKVIIYDEHTIAIPRHENGEELETFVLGLVDGEIPAMQSVISDEVTTFRI